VIQIKKPRKPPQVLQSRGKKVTKDLSDEYDADPSAYKGWTFDREMYGANSVKTALRKAQHEKCAFCESKVSHIAYGDVEHFRPKGGYRQRPEDPLTQPGYYWLAYDWSNLLFSCQICNQRHKRNHFPLLDAGTRARSHHDQIGKERPMFIQPDAEDPELSLEFNEEYLRAINGDERAQLTIEVLGLNRELIAERRRDALAKLRLLIECRDEILRAAKKRPNQWSAKQVARINAHLTDCTSDSGEYAAMVRSLVKKSALSTP
jgi:uncharacterized protein (TIGR02646 family)